MPFFAWWYNAGLENYWQLFVERLRRVLDFFSVSIILRTLFSPWKNDIGASVTNSLQDQIRVAEQGLISRLVGFFIRCLLLLTGAVVILILIAVGAALLMGWVLLPLLIVLLPVIAVLLIL